MLASLTGLLLTLGGDQPAVVFDPPLDPAIFDWDGQTLSLREGQSDVDIYYPNPLEPFDTNQKISFHQEVQVQKWNWGLDINDGSGVFDNSLKVFTAEGEDSLRGGNLIQSGRTFLVYSISAGRPGPIIRFTPNVDLKELQERVQSLEEALESCQCASDLDGDGAVGFNDLVQLISDWGPCSA